MMANAGEWTAPRNATGCHPRRAVSVPPLENPMRRTYHLVPSLALLVVAATAASAMELTDQGGGAAGAGEFVPGPRFGVAQQRQVVIRGLLDMDVINRGQYTTGNSGESDHLGEVTIRAEFGTSVKLDEQVKVNIAFAYQAPAGDDTGNANTITSNPNATNGFAVVDDAYVELSDFMGYQSLGVVLGRMPVAWNLREDHGSFIYASNANYPRVTSWDGGRASWNALEGIDITPFGYSMPGGGTLAGIGGDWKPAKSGDSRTFITGLVSYENSVPNPQVAPPNANGTGSQGSTIVLDYDLKPGKKLLTYSLGADFSLGDVDLFGEGAYQNGNMTSEVKYGGYGLSTGFDWHAYPAQFLVFGAQFDYLSGNKQGAPSASANNAFVNNWESVSDTYIVENEQYGELSRLLTGNHAYGLQALKLSSGVSFDDRGKIRLGAIYGYYLTAKSTLGHERKFGQEGDLTLSWRYTNNTVMRVYGGGFLPGAVFKEIAPGPNPSQDLVYCLGANLTIVF